MNNLRTFDYYTRRKPVAFKQALNWNPMMLEPTEGFLQAKEPGVRKAIKSAYLPELWGGLMGAVDEEKATTVLPMCVDVTMPIQYTAIIRRVAGVTAAFAYCELAKQLAGVDDLTDDYEVRHAMERGWEEFKNRAQEANAVQEGFGCDDSQSWQTLRDIGTEPNSKDLKAKLLAIAKLAGRMFQSFGYQKREMKNDDPEEVKGATVGGDLERVLPTELALLADADTEDAQSMKILTNRAVVQEMEGKEEKTRGPLVLCVDESGSMHDGDDGRSIYSGAARWHGRNTWAKACCVALTRIAWSENRPVRCVHFGNGTVVQDVPKDDTRALFEMARSFLSGGTSFGAALKRGRAVVGDLEEEGFEGADILLITDGEDYDTESHNRQIDHMDKAGIKLWTVAIGESIDKGSPVRKRAEKYTYAHDRELKTHATATKLAEGLDKAAMGNTAPGDLN